jgi:hypothetical protein
VLEMTPGTGDRSEIIRGITRLGVLGPILAVVLTVTGLVRWQPLKLRCAPVPAFSPSSESAMARASHEASRLRSAARRRPRSRSALAPRPSRQRDLRNSSSSLSRGRTRRSQHEIRRVEPSESPHHMNFAVLRIFFPAWLQDSPHLTSEAMRAAC